MKAADTATGFWNGLNYTAINEDWRPEASWLRSGVGERILCITGGGDRPLNLLAAGPAQVHAIDCNPAQDHLLALKVAALQHLEHGQYTTFLGLHTGSPRERRSTLRDLLRDLEPATQEFWKARPKDVASGILYRGRWERYFGRAALLGTLAAPGMVRELFRFTDLDAQRAFVAQHWQRPAWRATFGLALSRPALRWWLGDPAFESRHRVSPGKMIHDRMEALLLRCLAKESAVLGLVLTGRLSPDDMPPYLDERESAVIRARTSHLTHEVANLLEHLESCPSGRYTGFSLSDVPSFLDEHEMGRLLKSIARAAAPGARIVMRQFLTRYDPGDAMAPGLRRDRAVERQLASVDRSFAYDFLAWEAVDHAK